MKIKEYTVGDLLFEVFKFEIIDQRMYVLRCQKNVLIIDPHADEDLKNQLDADSKIMILLTHEHFDHISGIDFYRQYFECRVMCSCLCRDKLYAKDNGTSRFPFLFIGDKETYASVKKEYSLPYYPQIDGVLEDGEKLDFCGHKIVSYYTPGHSGGGMSYLFDEIILFAGDNLLGNKQELRSIDSDRDEFMKTMNFYSDMNGKNILLFPGHGEISSFDDMYTKVRSYV